MLYDGHKIGGAPKSEHLNALQKGGGYNIICINLYPFYYSRGLSITVMRCTPIAMGDPYRANGHHCARTRSGRSKLKKEVSAFRTLSTIGYVETWLEC